MKIFSIIAVLAASLSCGNSADNQSKEGQPEISASVSSENNNTGESGEDQETMLIGKLTLEDLQAEPHQGWFNRVYNSYKPSEEQLEIIKKNIQDYEIEMFLGTWCPDSRREVPKLFKILELADYDMDKLLVVGADTDKSFPDNVETNTEFERVPTIVFYKNGEEVNRFVEFAQESFEEDIAKIVSGKDYSNPYAE